MGVYIEGLDRPRGEYMRIHIDFDGEVWVFRGSEWKSLGIKATNLDLVRCGECKWWDRKDKESPFGYCHAEKHCHFSKNWEICIYRTYKADHFCADGERRADEYIDKGNEQAKDL